MIKRENINIPFVYSCDEFGLASSLWRIRMVRIFHKLISNSEDNTKARQYCEEAFESAKTRVIDEVGAVYFEDESDSVSYSREKIQNSPHNRLKGVCNQRMKSVIEKTFNQAKGRREIAQMAAFQTKIIVQAFVQVMILYIILH